jgi:hypothetical protein
VILRFPPIGPTSRRQSRQTIVLLTKLGTGSRGCRQGGICFSSLSLSNSPRVQLEHIKQQPLLRGKRQLVLTLRRSGEFPRVPEGKVPSRIPRKPKGLGEYRLQQTSVRDRVIAVLDSKFCSFNPHPLWPAAAFLARSLRSHVVVIHP